MQALGFPRGRGLPSAPAATERFREASAGTRDMEASLSQEETRCWRQMLKKKLGVVRSSLNQGWQWTEVTGRRDSAQEHVQQGEAPKD